MAYNEFEKITVEDEIDEMPDNVISAGRYLAEVVDAKIGISKSENPTLWVRLRVKSSDIDAWLSMKKSSKMYFRFLKFLFCIGIRSKAGNFDVTRERIVGSKTMVDVGIEKDTAEDGTEIKKNVVRDYSPLEQETAPMNGVPPETETPPAAETVQEKKEEEEEVDDI